MSGTTSSEQILVVSQSPCLARRIRRSLEPAGYRLEQAASAGALAGHRRQRPFLLCFVDARGGRGPLAVAECVRHRPAERYVPVVESWQRLGEGEVPPGNEVFGFLREPFSAEEVRAWSRRATDEARLLQGDRSLEELLYSRFRFFLRNLGPQPMTSLHALMSERVERPLLTAVLEWTGGNQTRAAEILGIHRNTLRAKVRSLGIEPSGLGGDG